MSNYKNKKRQKRKLKENNFGHFANQFQFIIKFINK